MGDRTLIFCASCRTHRLPPESALGFFIGRLDFSRGGLKVQGFMKIFSKEILMCWDLSVKGFWLYLLVEFFLENFNFQVVHRKI